jgi:hypothetical protein
MKKFMDLEASSPRTAETKISIIGLLLRRQPNRWKKDLQKELCRNSKRCLCLKTKDIKDVLRTAEREKQRHS